MMHHSICIFDEVLLKSGRTSNRSHKARNRKVPQRESFKKSIVYQAPNPGNKLPDTLKHCDDLDMFKKYLKKFMYTSFCEDGFVQLMYEQCLSDEAL